MECNDNLSIGETNNSPPPLPPVEETMTQIDIPHELAVINWNEALSQVGNDCEFMFEVLHDMKIEIDEAIQVINASLKINDFVQVSRIAHRVKGSCAYLSCERLQHVSEEMQHLHSKEMSDDMKLKEYTLLFNNFQEYAKELIDAVEEYHAHLS